MCDFRPIAPSGRRLLPSLFCAWLALAVALPICSRAQTPVLLTNIAQVRATSLKDGAAGIPLRLRATITFIDANWQMIFVQDDTGASYLETSVSPGDPLWSLPPGEIVDIEGVTSAGPQQCNIHARVVHPVSQGNLPKAVFVGADDALGTNLDSYLLTASGVITGVETVGRRLNFTFRSGPKQDLHLTVSQGNPVSAATLLGSLVDATGVLGLEFDSSNRPMSQCLLWINDLAAVQHKRDVSVTPIADLLNPTNRASAALVRIRGHVVSQNPGDSLYLRDDSGGVRVNSHATNLFGVGSAVEAFGYPAAKNGVMVVDGASVASTAPPTAATDAPASLIYPIAADTTLPALTLVSQVRNLSAKDASRGYPARLTGVITYNDTNAGIQFLQDRSGGIYIDLDYKKFDVVPEVGRVVEITGFSGPGDFAPVIEAEQMRVFSQGALPKPRSISVQALMTGAQDSQWIVLDGVIRRQSVTDNTTVLALATSAAVIDVTFLDASNHPAARSYVDAWVEIRGVCGSVFDSQRRLQGVKLYSPNWDQLRTWSDGPDDPFRLPIRSVSELLQFHAAADGLHRSHVRGTVLLRRADGAFYLKDTNGAILIQPQTTRGLIEPGQVVDLVGFPSVADKWPVLQDAEVRAMGQAAKVDPILVAPETPLSQTLHGDLVRLSARVLSHSSSAAQESLTLQFGPLITDAIIGKSQPGDQLANVQPGSVVELTGVYLARVDDNQKVQSFQLQLRSAQDVRILSQPSWWTARRALWVFAALVMALGLVLAWVTLLRRKVNERTRALRAEIEERKRMEAQMERTHKELLIASRGAGMAEVATSVLHNVGNVLNSVNVSANIIAEAAKRADLTGLNRVTALVREHAHDLPEFLVNDPKGKQLPKYLDLLAERHQAGHETVLSELESLTRNINHINDIVSMQQNYAKAVGVTEVLPVATLIEDALQMNRDALSRHDVRVVLDYEPYLPEITIDKHKILQILVNLITNARLACQEANKPEKILTIRSSRQGTGIRIAIIDNGVGIAPENMTRIFSHGFTTRKNGHGFGLHSGALTARELGGALTAQSDGPGFGAQFILDLPLHPPADKSATRALPAVRSNGHAPLIPAAA